MISILSVKPVATSTVERVVFNALGEQCSLAASYSRLRRFPSPSSSEKPIHLTLLSLQVASVSCAIWQSPSSSRQFAPSFSAGRKPEQSLSSAWVLSSVFLQFLFRRLPLFLRSLP